ncbi:MAG: energy transducer TonB [Bacteroidales bacterium]|nr:energy transducer TonB [Bacteroidales bacterium]MBP3662225.1 energy transducer TonB [Bacteroidales bacterium]
MDFKKAINDLLSRLRSEDKAGLYITVIFHLTVIIVLLAYGIDSTLKREESFVLDFSRQEEIERVQKERAFKEDISKKLDQLIEMSRQSSEPIRNIAVDAGSALKDDRGTDAEELYKEAERLAQELKNGQQLEDATEETVELEPQKKPEKKEEKKEYSGPSVVSYNLEGRKASTLKIPAYRCYGSGDVTVIITVDNSGRVVGAKVMEEISSDDSCLRSFAIRAARLSRFSASSTAPPRQTGEILYRFIAQ